MDLIHSSTGHPPLRSASAARPPPTSFRPLEMKLSVYTAAVYPPLVSKQNHIRRRPAPAIALHHQAALMRNLSPPQPLSPLLSKPSQSQLVVWRCNSCYLKGRELFWTVRVSLKREDRVIPGLQSCLWATLQGHPQLRLYFWSCWSNCSAAQPTSRHMWSYSL